MANERPSPEIIYQRIETFVRLPNIGPKGGVNGYTLSGPVDVPTQAKELVGLFPEVDPALPSTITIVGNSGESMQGLYSRILRLSIPERIARLNLPVNPMLARLYQTRSAMLRLPHIALLVGEAVRSKEEVMILYAIQGLTPEQALAELQDRARQRLVSQN